MLSVTYIEPRSNTGIGHSCARDEADLADRFGRYEIISVEEMAPLEPFVSPVDNCLYQGRARYGHTFPGFCTADSCY
jgi:hypothetical protein